MNIENDLAKWDGDQMGAWGISLYANDNNCALLKGVIYVE